MVINNSQFFKFFYFFYKHINAQESLAILFTVGLKH